MDRSEVAPKAFTASDFHQMSTAELQHYLQGLRVMKMSLQGLKESGRPNSGALRQNRIAIARILTILRKRGA